MKHGVKPTYEQRKLMEHRGVNTYDWLVIKDTPTEMVLVNKHSDQTKTIPKGVIKDV